MTARRPTAEGRCAEGRLCRRGDPEPGRRAAVLDLRVDHDPERQLLQVRELRHDERLRVDVNHRDTKARRRTESHWFWTETIAGRQPVGARRARPARVPPEAGSSFDAQDDGWGSRGPARFHFKRHMDRGYEVIEQVVERRSSSGSVGQLGDLRRPSLAGRRTSSDGPAGGSSARDRRPVGRRSPADGSGKLRIPFRATLFDKSPRHQLADRLASGHRAAHLNRELDAG